MVLAVLGACGKKTQPVPYGSVEPLAPIEEVRVYVRGETLVSEWEIPGETTDQQEARAPQISAFRIGFLQPEPGCFACKPETKGKLLVSPLARILPGSDLQTESFQAHRLSNVLYRLEIPLDALPEGDYLRLTFDYLDAEGASSPTGPSLPIRRPGPIPKPKILNAQWGPADCGESCPQLSELRLHWRRDLARRLEVLDPAGGRYLVEEHYRLRLFYLNEGVERLAHEQALLTDRARLNLAKQPLLARQEDQYGNLGPAAEINP